MAVDPDVQAKIKEIWSVIEHPENGEKAQWLKIDTNRDNIDKLFAQIDGLKRDIELLKSRSK